MNDERKISELESNIFLVEEPGLSKEESKRVSWIQLYLQTRDIQRVCSRFGVSKKTFYKWLKRYKEANGDLNSLHDRSRRPHSFPRATPPDVVLLLIKARNETGFGQRRLKSYMAKHHNINLSERTIWKLLKNNVNRPRWESGEDRTERTITP
jgi:transposase